MKDLSLVGLKVIRLICDRPCSLSQSDHEYTAYHVLSLANEQSSHKGVQGFVLSWLTRIASKSELTVNRRRAPCVLPLAYPEINLDLEGAGKAIIAESHLNRARAFCSQSLR
eukprot:3372687-Amphidinium_carterae.1